MMKAIKSNTHSFLDATKAHIERVSPLSLALGEKR